MLGLSSTPAATSALLLNLEGVLTAVIAWVVFRENVDSQVFLGMVAIVAGGTLLSWTPGQAGVPVGALLIVGACLCWAVDNNLTRKVAANDAMVIACAKGLIAGPVNIGIALATGATLPAVPVTAAAMLTGLGGYGISLVLFVVALRHLGSARGRIFLDRAAVRRRAVAADLARAAARDVLDRGRADGARDLAARSRTA